MSSEIATWGMIRAKVPTFPAPASGRDNECLTKSEILSLGGGNVHVEGSYGDGECVMLDNVVLVIWEYTFSVAPASLYFGSTGGTKSVQVTSYKRKYFGSNYTGEQVDVGFSSSAPGNGFSSSGTSVTAGNNTTTSQRSGTVTFTQYESGKPGYVSCNQARGTVSYDYVLEAPYNYLTVVPGTRDYLIQFHNYKRMLVNGVVVNTEDIGGIVLVGRVLIDSGNVYNFLTFIANGNKMYVSSDDIISRSGQCMVEFKNERNNTTRITFEVQKSR